MVEGPQINPVDPDPKDILGGTRSPWQTNT
jgi:hypothetical protein